MRGPIAVAAIVHPGLDPGLAEAGLHLYFSREFF